jgi:hypothetical protein
MEGGEGEGGEAKEGEEKKEVAERCHHLFKAGDFEECLSGWFSHETPRGCCLARCRAQRW